LRLWMSEDWSDGCKTTAGETSSKEGREE
jgi:hypothetical protein